MNLVQHSLVTLHSVQGDVDRFKEEIPFTLLPDAIRFYTGAREFSHFEINPVNNETSWMKFPENVRDFSKEQWMQTEKFLAPDIKAAKTGEETQVQIFEQHNKHLPELEYSCIKRHLLQDRAFDAYLRDRLDTTHKHEGKYYFSGKEYSDSEIRPLITKMETEGIVLLAEMIHETYGITIDQEWINENIIKSLQKVYPEEMLQNTVKFLQVDERTQDRLQRHQYEIDCMLDKREQREFYENIAKYIPVYEKARTSEKNTYSVLDQLIASAEKNRTKATISQSEKIIRDINNGER